MGVKRVVADWAALGKMKNGLIERIYAKFVDEIARDCENAPDILDARQLTITISAKPVREMDTGELDYIDTAIAFGRKLPKRVATARMEVDNGGGRGQRRLTFNEDFPDEPDQAPLPFRDDAKPGDV